jgi:MFS family permease
MPPRSTRPAKRRDGRRCLCGRRLRIDPHASLQSLEWTVNAYNLSFACLLLTGAALGDRFGRRRMYTIGLLLFTGASAKAALSSNAGMLVAARAV